MTFRAAMSELGLEKVAGLTLEELRRTYMRKLREHPPEQDPEGFARLRTAFELLRRSVPRGQAPAAVPPPIVEAPPPPPPVTGPPPPIVEVATPPSPAPRPPETMDAHVARLIKLLQAGVIEEARTAERTWREEHGGDDCRRATPFAAARWLLVRELVGVAHALPGAVLGALADALASSDLSNARTALMAYRATNAWAAANANALLERRAPTIHRQISGWLARPPRRDVASSRRPAPNQGSGSPTKPILGIVGAIFAVVLMTVGRMNDRPLPTYQPLPTYEPLPPSASMPDLQVPDLAPPDLDPLSPAPVRPLDATLTAETLAADIVTTSHVIATERRLASPRQREAAAMLERAAAHPDDCRRLLVAMKALDHAPPSSRTADARKIEPTLEALRARVAVLCPFPEATP